jgi:ABC-type phosphate/phosphonate transport system substrate-binding protein
MAVMSLPMYDWVEVREATDRWAAGLARHIGEAGIRGVDEQLVRFGRYSECWHRSDLVLSQTCGYPLTHALAGSLKPVATPHYRCEGCDGPRYRSVLFVRSSDSGSGPGDLAGCRAAFNSRDSMSGMLALKLVFAPFAGRQRFFAGAIETGSHMESLAAVAQGNADVCAVDCVVVAYARRHRPRLLAGLVEIARSPPVPALPYVTAAVTAAPDVARLRRAIAAAALDPQLDQARSALFIDGFSELTADDYKEILALERDIPATANVELW